MRKYILLLLLALGFSSLTAQSYRPRKDKPRLYVKSKQQRGDYIGIQYEINYPGFIELHLFENVYISEESRFERKLLFIRGKVTDKTDGTDYISFPVSSLESGKSYPYEIHYKGDTINGSVMVQP